jgi:hypothetical protein
MKATGEFEVSLVPQEDADGDATLGRMTIDKIFRGDLTAKSKGQMLTAMTAVEGSAAYVAVERVTGTLAGREGSFALQHTGVMSRGAPHLSIAVVPDSGTGELEGLKGTMKIEIVGGRHLYDLDYAFDGEG